MSLAAKLQLRQSQSLVMTPQLMQSIKLLQMTHIELDRFVEEEIERNPLLERADQAPETDAPTHRENADLDASPPLSAEAMSETFDASLENIFPDDPGVRESVGPELAMQWKSVGNGSNQGAGEGFAIEDIAAMPVSLRDHVLEQIAFAFADRGMRAIAIALCDRLDENGYLTLAEDEAELFADGRGGDVLAACQAFDPPGVFARDLSECLSLQLSRCDRLDPAMRELTENLELVARRDFKTLERLCGVDKEDILDMVAELRRLDPRPGLAFSSGNTETVVADVEVRPASDGSWAIELNSHTLPRVLVDQNYFAIVSASARSAADKSFLSNCMQSANWLTRSLDQRARTILKVATEIVKQQDAFLVHGVRHLRPLNLRTVADAIGMHESTVSRVTANKYMQTPRGIFELRYFFTAAIASAGGGDAHSSEAVRDRIRQLIEEERPVEVLSDDAIVDRLRAHGVDIARRTVAKYREGMNIPSSVQRRREKQALEAVYG